MDRNWEKWPHIPTYDTFLFVQIFVPFCSFIFHSKPGHLTRNASASYQEDFGDTVPLYFARFAS